MSRVVAGRPSSRRKGPAPKALVREDASDMERSRTSLSRKRSYSDLENVAIELTKASQA